MLRTARRRRETESGGRKRVRKSCIRKKLGVNYFPFLLYRNDAGALRRFEFILPVSEFEEKGGAFTGDGFVLRIYM